MSLPFTFVNCGMKMTILVSFYWCSLWMYNYMIYDCVWVNRLNFLQWIVVVRVLFVLSTAGGIIARIKIENYCEWFKRFNANPLVALIWHSKQRFHLTNAQSVELCSCFIHIKFDWITQLPIWLHRIRCWHLLKWIQTSRRTQKCFSLFETVTLR